MMDPVVLLVGILIIGALLICALLIGIDMYRRGGKP